MQKVAKFFSVSLLALLVILIYQYFKILNLHNTDPEPALFLDVPIQPHPVTDPWLQSLNEVLLSLKQSHRSQLPPSIHALNKLKKIIKHSEDKKYKVDNPPNSSELVDVCPEKWISNEGFISENCTNVRPLSNVITVILNFHSKRQCKSNLPNILSGISKFYPSISVYISSKFASCAPTFSKNLRIIGMNNKTSSGRIWNRLIEAATTPYVLIGRNLNYFDNFSQIERQIRMLSYSEDIVVAGGSHRNKSGHWKVGCYQLSLRNYVLKYEEGYYVSRNECMFCDHLTGSFVARKKLFKKFPFSSRLPRSVIFENFFINLKNRHKLVVNCPDVMYFSTNPYDWQLRGKYHWLPLVKMLKINVILLPGYVKYSYTCTEASLGNCKAQSYPFLRLLFPICCLEQFDRMVHFLQEFCERNNIYIEYDAGAALGAIKLRTLAPWDIDMDATFYDTNYSLFRNSASIFSYAGFVLNHFKSERHSYFEAWSPDIKQQMWGFDVTSKDLFLTEKFKDFPTKALMYRTWIHVEVNPALVARNLYGKEILKHSNSWLQLGMRNGFEPYNPNSFLSCQKPGHHACQDQFLADGSLQFYKP